MTLLKQNLLAAIFISTIASGQTVKSVQPNYVSPGTTLTLVLAKPATVSSNVVLSLDGEPLPDCTAKLEKGNQEVKFDLLSCSAPLDLFLEPKKHKVSLAPGIADPLTTMDQVTFGPQFLKIDKIERNGAADGIEAEISPGEKLKVTFDSTARSDQQFVAYVDGTATPSLKLKIRKGERSAVLPIPVKLEDAEAKKLFQGAASRIVSFGPEGGKPMEGARGVNFQPSGVLEISRVGDLKSCPGDLKTARTSEECWLRLGDQISLKVATPIVEEIGSADILLWIDGNPIPGLKASRDRRHEDADFTWLVFRLPSRIGPAPSSDASILAARDVWMRLLRKPWDRRGVSISAGKADAPLFTRVTEYPVQRLRSWWYIGPSIAFFALVIFWVYRAATRTGLLREPEVKHLDGKEMELAKNGTIEALQVNVESAKKSLIEAETALALNSADPQAQQAKTSAGNALAQAQKALDEAQEKANPAKSKGIIAAAGNFLVANLQLDPYAKTRAYSLARTQMLLWTIVVAMSMVWIWFVTNNYEVISLNVLALMGVSTVTFLTGTTLDANKKAQAEEAESKAAPGVHDDETKQALTTPRTHGFWMDLLSDRNGPTVARVQMAIFTAILMIMFIVETATALVMPEFSPYLIGLMGLSSATYVSFKFPEKKV